jgi:multiple sugar transport system permease protein
VNNTAVDSLQQADQRIPNSRISTQRNVERKLKNGLISIVKHSVLIVVGFFYVLPLLWMLSTALKKDAQVIAFPPVWIPNPVMWSNFVEAFSFVPFATFLKNSIIISGLTVFGALISCIFPAYSFSHLNWKGRDFVFFLMICTLMLPYQVTMIPVYLIFNKLKWLNTLLPLIVPSFFGGAFYIFLMRQFLLGIPKDLSDAALIDGCNDFKIIRYVILPLSKPVIMTVALFQFLNSWNDFMGPLIYLNDKNLYTVSLGLALMRSAYGLSRFSLIMAAAAMFVVPTIILFFFAQKSFIQGITFTGLKG